VRRIFARGSTLGIRAVAVAVLALGLIGGLFAGTRSNSDTLTAVDPAAAEVTTAPEPLRELAAQREVKTRVAEVRQSASAHAAAVAQAEAKAKAAAAAARKAAAKAAADAARAEEERKAKAERASRSASRSLSGPSSGGGAPPVPVDCASYSGNKQIGCSLLSSAGFDSGQMSCLEPLWTRESGWNERAGNQSSGAYGIPQALPGNKMASYGADWETNPVTQIKWGLNYIKSRYGTPCGAWNAFQSKGWY
jgi:ribosomal protein L12E/L44/L45/RPP1/RPP2